MILPIHAANSCAIGVPTAWGPWTEGRSEDRVSKLSLDGVAFPLRLFEETRLQGNLRHFAHCRRFRSEASHRMILPPFRGP